MTVPIFRATSYLGSARPNSAPRLYEVADDKGVPRGRFWVKDRAFMPHPLAEHATGGLAHLLGVGPPVALVDPTDELGRWVGRGDDVPAHRWPPRFVRPGDGPFHATADLGGAQPVTAAEALRVPDQKKSPTYNCFLTARLACFWAWVAAARPQLLVTPAGSIGAFHHTADAYGPDAPLEVPEIDDGSWRMHLRHALVCCEAITDRELAGLTDCTPHEPPRWYGTDDDRADLVRWLADRRDRLRIAFGDPA